MLITTTNETVIEQLTELPSEIMMKRLFYAGKKQLR